MLAACSVGLAISGGKDPDLHAVRTGAARADVEAQLGKPVKTVSLENGATAEVYAYEIGNEPSVARAVGHAIADLVTLGIWELAGTPLERSHEAKWHLAVYYDDAGNVTSVRPVEGLDMLMAEVSGRVANGDNDAAVAPVERIAGPAREKVPASNVAPPAAPSTPAGPPAAPASVGSSPAGRYRIQLASLRSHAAAEREGARLQAKWADVLGEAELVVVEKDIRRRGTFFRVQFGSFATMEAARATCALLHAREQACFPLRR